MFQSLLSFVNIFICFKFVTAQQPKVLNIGLLFEKNHSTSLLFTAYQSSAAAVLIAEDRIKQQQILPEYVFNYTIRFDECSESKVSGLSVELMRDLKVDAVIGPTCSYPAIQASIMSKFYNIPMFVWGLTTNSELTDAKRFPTIGVVSFNSLSLSIGIRRILIEFGWYEFAFLYSGYGDPETCDAMKIDIQTAMNMMTEDSTSVVISFTKEVLNNTKEAMIDIINEGSQRARIFVICFPEGWNLKRTFMLAAKDSGHLTDEYLYIFADPKSQGFTAPRAGGLWRYQWEQIVGTPDGRDAEAHEAFKYAFVITDFQLTGMDDDIKNFTQFEREVVNRMKDPPFYCTTECQGKNFSVASKYAGQLHDAMITYAMALNRTLAKDPMKIRNGTNIIQNMMIEFQGASGFVRYGKNGTRLPDYHIMGLNSSGFPEVYAKVYVEDLDTKWDLIASDSVIWWNRKDQNRPLAVPICGFSGNECPVNFVQSYLVYILIAGAVLFAIVMAAVVGVIYTIRARQEELKRLDQQWQVPVFMLRDIPTKKDRGLSSRSLQSGVSSHTKTTTDNRTETRNYKFFILNNEKVAALKHAGKPKLDADDCKQMRELRKLEHDNLNRFIGLCQDTADNLSIWRLCGRGSLQDVISKGSLNMDYFFVYALIRDIVQGLQFIHSSFLSFHGHLSSTSCLVDDRFQVKISYFGLQKIREADKAQSEDLLWTAPEILCGEVYPGSKEGDIYSLAIICSELVTRKPAWDINNRKEAPDTLIYSLKRDRGTPPRPDLTVHESLDVNQSLLELISDSWSQEADRRPDINQIRTLLKGMNSGGKENLMDHVFNIMETYAATLEEEVTSRTRELTEEKKKSDLLLYRMLPRQVADKLKLGLSVQPETFDSVTVFFSDVVAFTILASKCTPLQVVNLLNDLYSIFDGIIEKHDAYKVETIGDGYLCVSGLPHRNGNEHAKEIASMSLGFMESLTTFKIPHLPNERVNLRIGLNCGSVVAGVVGLTMPRYCLFGDTVNTASRMESNGKPGQIHMTSTANHMLTKVVGGFKTTSRGEVIIKGKGVMETFWLLGRSDGSNEILRQPETPKHKSIERQATETTIIVTDEVHKIISPIGSDMSSPRSISPIMGIYQQQYGQKEK